MKGYVVKYSSEAIKVSKVGNGYLIKFSISSLIFQLNLTIPDDPDE